MLTKPNEGQARLIAGLTGTPEWQAVMAILEQERVQIGDALVRATTIQEIHRYQGAAILLDEILRLGEQCRRLLKP